MGRSRKPLRGQLLRGFESLSLRHHLVSSHLSPSQNIEKSPEFSRKAVPGHCIASHPIAYVLWYGLGDEMAKSGAHPMNALTAVGVRNTKQPGRYADGNGLYLHVRPTGSKSWTLRLLIRGVRKDIGLGSVAMVPLAEAREVAAHMRKIARAGGDPIAERNSEKATAPTFREAAIRVHESQKPTWRNAKHGAQWISTLERYVFPLIGEKRVNEIESGDVLRVLGDIWLTKPETARRVRQRISTVLDWARAAGHRDGENPCAGITRGLPKQPERTGKHHAAMAYDAVPSFLQETLPELAIGLSSKLALEFLILTAARTTEVLEADWSEVDLDAALWTVPATRMKAGREHRVRTAVRKSSTGAAG